MKVEKSSRGIKTSVFFRPWRRRAADTGSTSIRRWSRHHPEIRAGRGPANIEQRNRAVSQRDSDKSAFGDEEMRGREEGKRGSLPSACWSGLGCLGWRWGNAWKWGWRAGCWSLSRWLRDAAEQGGRRREKMEGRGGRKEKEKRLNSGAD